MSDNLFDVPCALCNVFITKESQEASSPGSIISSVQIIDSHRFWYGISGVFKFKIDLNIKKGDVICNDCLKQHRDNIEEDKSIKCSLCNELYQPVHHSSSDGFDCAASIYKKEDKILISCGWGSRYDLDTFNVVNKFDFKNDDLICDNCLDKMLKDQEITINKRIRNKRGME